MSRLLLIDLSHLFWTNWHATADKPLSEAYTRTLADVSRLHEGAEHVAICIDSPPYWRKAIAADYKAQRDTPEPQAVDQFRRVKERLAADGRVLWAAPSYEADDIIAGAVHWARTREPSLDVTIASSDKDLLQLVDDGVAVYSLRTQTRMGPAEVEAKFGVPPSQMRDLLAIMGDSADNVPGVKGVGPKKGAALLAQYGDIDEMYLGLRLAVELDQRELNATERAMIDGRTAVYNARALVTLKTDAPVDYESLFRPREVKPIAEQAIQDAEWTEDSSPRAAEPTPEQKKEWEETVSAAEKEAPEEQKRATAVTSIVKATAEEWSLALEPNDSRDAYKMARAFFESRLYQAFGNPDAIFAVILRGRALGLDATTALSCFHVVEGRPVMHASLIVGLVLNSGKAEYFDCTETTNNAATWETKRKGAKSPMEIQFAIEDAYAAGLVQRDGNGYRGVSRSGKPSNWDKYRRTMLRWRAATELARVVYPDVVAGLYTPDEVSEGQDIGESAAE